MAKERAIDLERLREYLEHGRVVPTLADSYPLSRAKDAMRLEASQVPGKVDIRPACGAREGRRQRRTDGYGMTVTVRARTGGACGDCAQLDGGHDAQHPVDLTVPCVRTWMPRFRRGAGSCSTRWRGVGR